MKPSRPSATSLLIAEGTLFLGGHPDYSPLVPIEAEALSRSILKAWSPFRYRMIQSFRSQRWFQAIISFIEESRVPGMLLHYQLRKRQIEAWLHLLHRQSPIERLVILGAGMDTLGWRWASEFPVCQVIEVDHPQTQAAKLYGVSGFLRPDNLSFQAADLQEVDWQQMRSAFPEWGGGEPRTVVVAEGLFMYLELSEVQSLLRDSVELDACTWIFTFMENDPSGRPSFRGQDEAVDRWLRRQGESFVWGSSLSSMRQRLQHLGLLITEKAEAKDLQGRFRYLVPGRLASATGEIMVLCKRR